MKYEDFSNEYDRILVPRRFNRPARDLVTHIDRTGIQKILDVGTGTGSLLDHCKSKFNLSVGIDLSLAMLRTAFSKGHKHLVSGTATSLPFNSSSFDAISAGFVLSHIASIESSLKEFHRVLRIGGIVVVTSWGEIENDYRTIWKETIDQFLNTEAIFKAVSKMVPHEDLFSDPSNVVENLQLGGFKEVEYNVINYKIKESPRAFVEARSFLLSSQLIKDQLGVKKWDQLCNKIVVRLNKEFTTPLKYELCVNFVWAYKR